MCAEAMEGGHLFVDRANLQECCKELACSLTNLNPYMKKSMLEAAIGCWDRQSKGNMSTQCGRPTAVSNQQQAATWGMW
jgi:hypothetical protein